MPIKLNSHEQRDSNIRTKNADKPIIPFLNFFKMRIKLNSLEQTVEAQISGKKSPINPYAVFYQITTNQTLL